MISDFAEKSAYFLQIFTEIRGLDRSIECCWKFAKRFWKFCKCRLLFSENIWKSYLPRKSSKRSTSIKSLLGSRTRGQCHPRQAPEALVLNADAAADRDARHRSLYALRPRKLAKVCKTLTIFKKYASKYRVFVFLLLVLFTSSRRGFRSWACRSSVPIFVT